MAQKDFSTVNLSGDAPQAWTIPLDAIPQGDKNQSVGNDADMPVPSAPDASDLPPNYYDISIVPNNAVLHFNEVSPYTEASKALVERKNEGVFSMDSVVDRNPDQLWLYFMTYLNEKPTLLANIEGYHMEYYTAYEQVRTADGHYHSRPVQRVRRVTDFSFTMDLTGYINPQWWRVAVIPSEKAMKAGEYVSLRDAIEQYTRSDSSIKNIVCQKQLLGWNFHDLSFKIKSLIYASGYRNHINVRFSVNNAKIEAQSSSKISRFSNSTLVRVLCVLSCMFLIFGPIYCCLRAAGSTRDRIVADYSMLTSSDQFLQMNAGVIATAAMTRSRDHFVAYLA